MVSTAHLSNLPPGMSERELDTCECLHDPEESCCCCDADMCGPDPDTAWDSRE